MYKKDYLAFAKSKKHSAKKIRKALRKQLGYVARDIRYTGTGRSDIPDKSKPELLQRTWHPFVRSKTWATGSECKSG